MRQLLTILFCFCSFLLFAQEGRTVISLNGEWEFDQTRTAFPPAKFTRKIPVPGLIHLAVPRVAEYDKFFQSGKQDAVIQENHNFLEDMNYTPMYNWYKRRIKIDKNLSNQQLFLTIKKSQYVTMVYVNGMFIGRSIECWTPIDMNITGAVKFGEENEILIQVGDRAWLPSEAAGGTDKEKSHYLPGIWDDVFISATGKLRVDRVLFLPSLRGSQGGAQRGNQGGSQTGNVTAKILIRSLYPPQMEYGAPMWDNCKMEFTIKEKKSGNVVATQTLDGSAKRDNRTYFELNIPIKQPVAWTPESPFLYEGEVKIYDGDKLTDKYSVNFGMRDFGASGKYFTLNGQRYFLRGSNITLQRFFEDPDCGNLAWDREWVKKMLIDIPKSLDWNAFRICVGIVPDFWYDLCDEYGIVLQNEWLYWQNHGWDEQMRREYTDWVWSDGNHPSIVIWDLINENRDAFIGNTLIPELKKLDPTRIYDAGYMTANDMGSVQMTEPHPYRSQNSTVPIETINDWFAKRPYDLGDLNTQESNSGIPNLVNEYGWIWLWRDGRPSKLTVQNYTYFLGTNATPSQRREMQAYWLQCETEWLRSERHAGILAFTHLTNNYGFTGDWFINNIKDLEEGPTLKWFKHCFAPQAVFVNLIDQRYMKHREPYKPGSTIFFNLIGVNDYPAVANGRVVVKLLNSNGSVAKQQELTVRIPGGGKLYQPCLVELPSEKGGYLMLAEFYPEGKTTPVVSRRYLKIGDSKDEKYDFYEIKL